MTDIVERVAQAIHAETSAGKLFPWDELSEPLRDGWRRMAQAAIDALNLTEEWAQVAHMAEQCRRAHPLPKLPKHVDPRRTPNTGGRTVMTAQKPQAEDGNLPAAKNQLADAVSALIDPKPVHHDTGIHWINDLYTQLTDEIPGSQGNASRVPQSSPPLCIDAAELKHEIDTAIAIWEPRPEIDASQHQPPPITTIRLRAIEHRGWRPQDVKAINQIVSALLSWCESIRTLLDPPPQWHLPNPCPACDVAVVHRRNSAGEIVRQPALKLGAHGCYCQNCHHEWAPAYFQHLAKVLGYDLPEGVLE